jgi:hypothetical protein
MSPVLRAFIRLSLLVVVGAPGALAAERATLVGDRSGGGQLEVPIAADTTLEERTPNLSFGGLPVLQLRSGNKEHLLLRVDDAELTARSGNRQVVSASLELFVIATGLNWGNGRTLGAHRVLTDWTERDATWRCPRGGGGSCPDRWDGGRFVAVPTGTALQTNAAGRRIVFDVTADVRAFLDGSAPNFGWLVKKTGPAANGLALYGSRENLPGLEPRLRIVVADDGGDREPPVIAAALAPPPNGAGWNATGVVVTFTCTDQESGVATCPDPVSFPGEGDGQSATVTATDQAGNTATLTVTVRIDLTAPGLAVTAPADGAFLPVADPPVEVGFADALSGIDTTSLAVLVDGTAVTAACTVSATGARCPTADLAPGEHTVEALVTDVAGNSTAVVGTFTVALPPPATPVLEPPPVTTAETTVVLQGTADPGVDIEILGGAFPAGARTGADGSFTVTVTLVPDALNRLFATAIDDRGLRSAPAAARVLQDGEAPSLFVDAPGDGTVTGGATTEVSGRVADRLSGFLGLTVTVGGTAAEVDAGIGTNGTFFLAGVPLAPGENLLEVVAQDAAGNRFQRTVAIERRAPEGAALTVLSGAGQRGLVGTPLTDPVRVRLTGDDGRPLANHPVVFTVERSDGRLVREPADGGEPALRQVVLTDAVGEAAVRWTLGSDAGRGNNRLRVSTAAAGLPVRLTATADPAPPSQIVVSSGDGQMAEAGGPAPDPLVVWVSDGRNGSAGVPVTFTVVGGDGRVEGQPAVTVNTSPTGHATVAFELGAAGVDQVVEATFPGNPGPPVSFVAFGVERIPGQPTRFAGVVVDNAGRPIGGVHCVLEVGGVTQPAVLSAADGSFGWDDLPAGPAHLHVDGLVADTLDGLPIPPGSFPTLGLSLVLVPEAANALLAPVRLPSLDPANARTYDGTRDVELTVTGIEGLRMVVRAGSMRRADGSVPGPGDPAVIALNQVHTDDVPMALPDGIAPPFAWTLQPSGATFDPPIEVSMPNMAGLLAGAVVYFLNFDHNLERFAIVASGRVSDDGSTLVSDPGGGIGEAGWGGICPPYPNSGDVERDPLQDAKDKMNEDVASREGTASAALAKQIQCLGQRACGGGPGSRPPWAQRFVSELLADIAENRATNPSFADEACRRIPPWLPVLLTPPPPLPPLPVPVNSADVCALAGGISHFTDELLPGFERHMGDQVREDIARGYTPSQAKARVERDHEMFLDVVPPCFDTVPELSTVGRGIAKRSVPVAARAVRGGIIRNICRSLGAPLAGSGFEGFRGETFLDPGAAWVPMADLFSPELDAASALRVRAPGEQFFLPVGSSVQLSVRDAAGNELAAADTGTLYFVAVGDDRITVSPDGLLTVAAPLSAYADLPGVFYVWVGNGDRLGIGQFAVLPADQDGDGVADSHELAVGLDPTVDSRDVDQDGDGVDDASEALAGSDPLAADSDGDGVDDGDEIAQGSDPRSAASREPRLQTGIAAIGNRFAVVQSDGSFRVRNVPLSTDLLRVQLSGRRGDLGLFGASAFVEVIDQRTVRLPGPIAVSTVPVATTATLDLAAAQPTVGTGDATQLVATATLSDGTAEEVTLRAQGTSYRSSNPAIASVGPDGLVTGHRPGRVFITARREGVATVVQLAVSPGGEATEVTGTAVLADATPAASAAVSIEGQLASATAGADGRFRIADVATGGGTVTVLAALRQPRRLVAAVAEGIVPVISGTTDIGTLTLTTVPLDDQDADGIPDLFERLFGFDPADPDGDDDGIPDGLEDLDGDGLPDWGELVVGSDPANPDSDGDGILDGDEDSDQDGLSDGFEARNGQNPLDPEAVPPTVTLLAPEDGFAVIGGSTLQVVAQAEDNVAVAEVELRVNGALLATVTRRPRPPEEEDEEPQVGLGSLATAQGEPVAFTLTVPEAALGLQLEVAALDLAGNRGTADPVQLSVLPDLGTTATGTVLDATGLPAPPVPLGGVPVGLQASGLLAEFFDFDAPPPTLPDLDGLVPDVVKTVSALNFRNPGGALASDTFGVGLAPDFAARFTGTLSIGREGFHRFFLGSDQSARLILGGVAVAEVVSPDDFTEATGEIDLPRGDVPIEVLYLHTVGSGELQLRVAPPPAGGIALLRTVLQARLPAAGEPDRGIVFAFDEPFVPTGELELPAGAFATTSAPDGTFTLTALPTYLGPLQAAAETLVGGELVNGRSASRLPVPGGDTDLGSVLLGVPGCLEGVVFYSGSCVFGSPRTVSLLVENEDGEFVPVDQVRPDDRFGDFCAVLRRRQRFILREEDVLCRCDARATCESPVLELTEPAAAACGEGPCQPAGFVPLTCDFFCGS